MDDIFGLGKVSNNSLEVVKMLYPDLAQPALKKVGLALEATIDFTTIPFKYLGLVSQKADMNIKKHLKNFQEKIDQKSEEEIGSVPPEIGVPILEELTRVTSEELSSMYINLLANAALVDNSRYAHPSFINVVRSLSVDEARIVQLLREDWSKLIFIRYERYRRSTDSRIPLTENVSNVEKVVTMLYPENSNFYINNLISLGIIKEENYFYTAKEPLYKDFENELADVKNRANERLNGIMDAEHKKGDYGNASDLVAVWGHYKLTYYGEEFIKAVTKL